MLSNLLHNCTAAILFTVQQSLHVFVWHWCQMKKMKKKNKFSFKQEKSTLDTKNSYSEACIFRVFYNVLYIKGYSLIISFFHLNNLIMHVFAFLCCFILQLPNSFPNCNNWKVCFNVPWQEKKMMVGLEFVLFALLFGALTRAEKTDCSSEHDKTEQPQFH